MVWARLDDRANSNGKLGALSDGAFRLWACGLIYCQANLTDGFIPDHAIATFGVRAKPLGKVALELTASLIPGKGPLWHAVPMGWQVHDYLDWNESRFEVTNGRAASKDRKERWKNRHQNEHGTRSATVSEQPTGTTATSTSTTETSKERKSQSAPTRALMAKFDELHIWRFGSKAAFNGAKDAKRLADVWKHRQGDPIGVEELIEAFFRSRDPFVVQAGFSVGVFVSQIPKLLSVAAKSVVRVDWVSECEQLHGSRCGSATFHAAQMDTDREKSA